MSRPPNISPETVAEVRDRCLCLAVQRAARTLARRFDRALAPAGLTSGQFSVLVALNRDQPPRIAELATFLAMDRTTLTAALKVLHGRDLLEIRPDPTDRRGRQVVLTAAGAARLRDAVPLWRAAHDALDRDHPVGAGMHGALAGLAGGSPQPPA